MKLTLRRRVGATFQSAAYSTPWTATASSKQLVASGARALVGFSIAETAGAAAKVRLRDGTGTGTVLAVITLTASGSLTKWYADQSVLVSTGSLYLEAVSGSTEGTAYYQ